MTSRPPTNTNVPLAPVPTTANIPRTTGKASASVQPSAAGVRLPSSNQTPAASQDPASNSSRRPLTSDLPSKQVPTTQAPSYKRRDSPSAIIQKPVTSSSSSVTDLIKSGLGNLDLDKLFKFSTIDQISNELQSIAAFPRTYGVPDKYIDGTPQFLQSRGNQYEPLTVAANQAHQPGKSASFNTNGKSSIKQVVEYILRHIGQKGVFKIFIPPSSDEEDVYLGYGDAFQIGQTAYDALAWVLSVTALPQAGPQVGPLTRSSPKEYMERCFYLPLLAVYGRWCRILTFPNGTPTSKVKVTQDLSSAEIDGLRKVEQDPEVQSIILANHTSLSEDIVDSPSMFAITWFTDTKNSNIVMMGATPGAYRFRSYDTVRERQARLMQRGFEPDVPEGLAFQHPEGAEGRAEGKSGSINYGSCAETSFYLYGRVPNRQLVFDDESKLLDAVLALNSRKDNTQFQRLVEQQSTRGIAIRPFDDPSIKKNRTLALEKMASYDESQLINKLQKPCPKCQYLIGQLGWKWETTHDISTLRDAIRRDNPQAASSTIQLTSAQNKQAKGKGRGTWVQTPQATGSHGASGSVSTGPKGQKLPPMTQESSWQGAEPATVSSGSKIRASPAQVPGQIPLNQNLTPANQSPASRTAVAPPQQATQPSPSLTNRKLDIPYCPCL